MTLRFLLDTNIVVFALRSRPTSLRDRLSDASGRLAVSTITVSELAYGTERSKDAAANRSATRAFIANVEVLAFDSDAAEHAGEIRADLAKAGTPIGGYDVLIAGHARSRGLAVVTNNVREFARVPGLQVVDWSDES